MFLKNLTRQRLFNCLSNRFMSTSNSEAFEDVSEKKVKAPRKRRPSNKKIYEMFNTNESMSKIQCYVPKKHMCVATRQSQEHLYLVCPDVADKIVSHVLPVLKSNPDQIISDTNSGLGLVAQKLLDNGIPKIRVHEVCTEFRSGLSEFSAMYTNRVEVFIKELFLLYRYDYIDKHDGGDRVKSLLQDVPMRSWTDDPPLTIIGTMPHMNFLRYMIKTLMLQSQLVQHGRTQIFAIMKSHHYAVLTAGPEENLHTYQSWSVLYNLFFECKLLDTFPRERFLPWESTKKKKRTRSYHKNVDPNMLYFVQINFKKHLPLSIKDTLPFFYFVNQLYGQRANRVIPTIEKWVPNSGLNIIVPKLEHEDYFYDIGIYTKFGDLSPQHILEVFKEMINSREYSGSPFSAMIENELIKNETIETSLNDANQLETNIMSDIEDKMHEEPNESEKK